MDEFIYFNKKKPSMSKQIREWVREIAEILISPKNLFMDDYQCKFPQILTVRVNQKNH